MVIKAFVGKVNPMMIADLQSTNAPPPTAPTPNGATFTLVEETTTPSYGEEMKGSRTYENYDDEATGVEEESAGEDATSEYSAFNHRFQKRSLSRTSKVQRQEKSVEDRKGFRDEVSDFKRMEKKWTMPKGQPHIAIGTPGMILVL